MKQLKKLIKFLAFKIAYLSKIKKFLNLKNTIFIFQTVEDLIDLEKL